MRIRSAPAAILNRKGESALNKFNNNNRGFSLLEVVVCVFLLTIVVVPLLSAFKRSADYYSESKQKGEATAVAQNIRESVESYTVDDILNSNGGFVSMLGAESFAVNEFSDAETGKTYNDVYAKGIHSGSGNYDAVIHFDTDSEEARRINGFPIAQHTKLNSSFTQPGREINPDIKSAQIYKNDNGIDQSAPTPARRRVILVELSTKEILDPDTMETVGVTVSTKVTFQYHYQGSCNFYTSKDGYQGVLDNCQNLTYNLDDVTLSSYDEEYTLRLLYYPFFENPSTNDTVVSFIDIANFNPMDKQLKYNLILVKMNPMYNDAGEWKTVTTTNASSIYVPGSEYNSTRPTFKSADTRYKLDIVEMHPKPYNNISFHFDSSGNWIRTTFSNASKKMFNTTGSNKVTLKVAYFKELRYNIEGQISVYTLQLLSNYNGEFVDDQIVAGNSLVKTESVNRFYNITVLVAGEGVLETAFPGTTDYLNAYYDFMEEYRGNPNDAALKEKYEMLKGTYIFETEKLN